MNDDIYLVENAALFTATTGEVEPNQTMLVRHGKIEWLGPSSSSPSFSGMRIDASGHCVLPGLIDCHVHLSSDGAADFFEQVQTDSLPRATLRAARAVTAFLDHGITTVRDCGSANAVAVEVSKGIEDGLLEGPRVIAAGRVITMTGGHGYFIGREADGVDGARAATRAELKGGAEFIKVMATGGVLTPGVRPEHTALFPDELSAIVGVAHNAGRRVATHAIGAEGIKNAIRAGVDSVEHAHHLDEEGIELALEHRVFIVPTFVAVDRILEAGGDGGVPPSVVEKAEKEADRHRATFAAAVGSGLRIAAGTDSGTPFNFHGTLVDELVLMAELGLSNSDAILAATREAATNLDIHHRVGSLEVGKDADFIAVEGDPTRDLTALQHVRLVARAGHLYRSELPRSYTSGGRRPVK